MSTYAVNLDAIWQWSHDRWYLVEDFNNMGVEIPTGENPEGYDIVQYPVNLRLTFDDFNLRDGIMEICQDSPIHQRAMGL